MSDKKQEGINLIAAQRKREADAAAAREYNRRLFEQKRAEMAAKEAKRIADYRKEFEYLKKYYADLLNSTKKFKDYITPDFAAKLAEDYKHEANNNMMNALKIAIQRERERMGLVKDAKPHKEVAAEVKKKISGPSAENINARARVSEEMYRIWTTLGNWKELFLKTGDESSDAYKKGFNTEVVGLEIVRKRLDELGGPLNK